MFATADRAASGYLLEINRAKIWMDAGSGTWQNLLRKIDYRDLDGVVLSHRHPDHTTDVFQAFHARAYWVDEPLAPIPLWAPQETIDHLVGYDGALEKCFELRPVSEGDCIEIEGARFYFVRMAHPPVTLGVRIEDDGSVAAYSADSGSEADFEALASGADLFICEATFQNSDGEWEGHLSASQAAAIACRVAAGRLVLTHLPPKRDLALSLAQAQETGCDCDLRLAEDGLRLDVGP
jgi:ribonuclease BN (tRNA processing enzyme)